MLDPTLMSFVSDVSTPVAKDIAESLAKRFFSSLSTLMTSAKKKYFNDREANRTGLQNYLENSLSKCQHYKTIVDPTTPISVTANYVNLFLKTSDRVFVDTDIIKDLHKIRLACITGLAGCGKSMFMKYLTLALFYDRTGPIPILLELRTINDIQNQDLVTFARVSCAPGEEGLSEEHFRSALKAGLFAFVLDGFDELKLDQRETVEKQVLRLSKDYPKCSLIVSSRPDDRFGSWQSFYVFKVEDLVKDQTLRVIEGLPYDKDVKNRFKRVVDERLFESHRSFLSSPLLTSIMLLTYESFAEIPDRMHAFYSQAFDTLFQKHDAQKEQFKRQTHTNLTREEFKSAVSAFCVLTYLEESFTISEEKLKTFGSRAAELVKRTSNSMSSDFTGDQLVLDLHESVCLLQKDGLDSVFVHRSFQEYFSAYYVTKLPSAHIGRVVDRCARRANDSVVRMALDIDHARVELDWVLPTISRLREALKLDDKNVSAGQKYALAVKRINVHVVSTSFRFSMPSALQSDLVGPIQIMKGLYPNQMRTVKFPRLIDLTSKMDFISDQAVQMDLPQKEKFKRIRDRLKDTTTKKAFLLPVNIDQQDAWWLQIVGADRAITSLRRALNRVERDIRARYGAQSEILEGILVEAMH